MPVTPGMLVAGTNVVAVEFHKYAPNSTYLAFSTESQPRPAGREHPTARRADRRDGDRGRRARRCRWHGTPSAAPPATRCCRNGTVLGHRRHARLHRPQPAGRAPRCPTPSGPSTASGQRRPTRRRPTVTITPPAPPANLTATVIAGPSVQLTWDARRLGPPATTSCATAPRWRPSRPPATPIPARRPAPSPTRCAPSDAIGQQSADSAPASVTIRQRPHRTPTKPSMPGKPAGGRGRDRHHGVRSRGRRRPTTSASPGTGSTATASPWRTSPDAVVHRRGPQPVDDRTSTRSRPSTRPATSRPRAPPSS